MGPPDRCDADRAFPHHPIRPPTYEDAKARRIINISSFHGLVASEFKSAYVAAKHNIPKSEVIQKITVALAAIKRLVKPQEVTPLIVYVCSEAAQAITGAAIPTDCGWTAR
jgi:NAD(P)-dependent dehydrogenase (short-subunit alcohol dehydrogenase family)